MCVSKGEGEGGRGSHVCQREAGGPKCVGGIPISFRSQKPASNKKKSAKLQNLPHPPPLPMTTKHTGSPTSHTRGSATDSSKCLWCQPILQWLSLAVIHWQVIGRFSWRSIDSREHNSRCYTSLKLSFSCHKNLFPFQARGCSAVGLV